MVFINGYWLENTGNIRYWLEHKFTDTWKWRNTFIDFADLNDDGDLDVLVGNGPLSPYKKTYIYENLAGPGKTPTSSDWKEHVILEGFVSHDAVVGDVDGDGDLDIVCKEWTSGSVYYLENKLKD